MDEEDGRPGALAAEFGQADALMDALPQSLCLSVHIILCAQIQRPSPAPHCRRLLAGGRVGLAGACAPWVRTHSHLKEKK